MNLECMSEMCCSRLAANTGRKKVAKNRHLGTIAQLRRAISSQLRHRSTIGKNLLSSNIPSTCTHNMVNFGPLAAEIASLVWGTPANFNKLRVLASLLHGTLVVGVSQTAALNRGRHLYSAGRPSRWALAHISSLEMYYTWICSYICVVNLVMAALCNRGAIIFLPCGFFMVALCNRADHNIFMLFLLLSFFFFLA